MNIFSPDFLIFAAAVGIDLLFGEYPDIIHPVVWMGRMAIWFDIKTDSDFIRFILGGMLLVSNAALWFFIAFFSFKLPFVLRFAVQVFLLKSTFSITALYRHVKCCRTDDIERMRQSVSMIVSRDTSELDRPHLISASLESLSENISDSVIAPLFYYAIFGLPAAMIYRSVNTLDAMIGYRTKSFEWYGKASARADDLANFIPARITALIIALFSPRAAVRAIFKYAHTKLNAAYPMAAVSGVLRVLFEKKGVYRFDGREPEIGDIDRGLKLFKLVVAVSLALMAAIILLWGTAANP